MVATENPVAFHVSHGLEAKDYHCLGSLSEPISNASDKKEITSCICLLFSLFKDRILLIDRCVSLAIASRIIRIFFLHVISIL